MHKNAYFRCNICHFYRLLWPWYSLFRYNVTKFSRGHAPGPPYNGLAFGTSPKVDLWRHTSDVARCDENLPPLGNFLRTPLHSTGRILRCKPCKIYKSLFSKFYGTLIHNFPTLGCIGQLKTRTKSHVKFFQNLPVLLQSNSPLSETRMLCKFTQLFYIALTPLCFSVYALHAKWLIIWFKVSTKPSNKNIPNFSNIPNQKFIHQALSKYTKIFKFGIYRYQLAKLQW